MKLNDIIKNFLVKDENGICEFDRLYDYVSRKEKRQVKLDRRLCEELILAKDSSRIIITYLKSRELLRLLLMTMEESE